MDAMVMVDAPPFLGAQMSTIVYVLVVFLAILVAFLAWVSYRIASRKENPNYIGFQKSNNPPDQGIEQRIYKPEGEPARVHRNVFSRENVQSNRARIRRNGQ